MSREDDMIAWANAPEEPPQTADADLPAMEAGYQRVRRELSGEQAADECHAAMDERAAAQKARLRRQSLKDLGAGLFFIASVALAFYLYFAG